MLAAFLLAIGMVMIAVGARCAGSPGGYSTDRSGAVAASYPGISGTARCACARFMGDVLENGGYVILLCAGVVSL